MVLLAEGKCMYGDNILRIHKAEDGKFLCEEVSRSATCDSEVDVVKFLGAEPALRDMYDAAGISRAAFDLVWHLDNEDFRHFQMEQLIDKMKRLLP